ncbi:hypothetical protein ACP70R_019793 [Stipagrostis hirtigluma subsp. patula]
MLIIRIHFFRDVDTSISMPDVAMLQPTCVIKFAPELAKYDVSQKYKDLWEQDEKDSIEHFKRNCP